MTRFHITAKGDPGLCKAEVRGCPLGGDADHFDSAEEARSAFEASQGSALAEPEKKPSATARIGVQVAEEAASGAVYLTDNQRDAFDAWLEDNDKWGKEDQNADYHDAEYFAQHMQFSDTPDDDFEDHYNSTAILGEVRTRVTFFTDDSYRTTHGESITLRRKDIDGHDFDRIIDKHRR